jgi:hypothetical protein
VDGFTLLKMEHRVIHLHPAAPDKPAVGAACNGCGVCCATEPCPVGVVLTRRRSGPCDALRWDDSERRYRCGATEKGPRWWRAWLRRWIAAGVGCDATLQVQRR